MVKAEPREAWQELRGFVAYAERELCVGPMRRSARRWYASDDDQQVSIA